MTESSKPALERDHAAHDPSWMAALASRDPDLSTAERASAEAALASCGSCADLFAELVAVSAAIPSAAIPARPRDFTLTAADAERLRSRGLRRWLAGIGSVRDGVTFPLAMGLTTMGIAGLLFATVPAALSGMGGAASGPAPQELSTVGAPVPERALASAAAAASAAPTDIAAPAAGAASAAPSAGSADVYEFSTIDPDTTGEDSVFSGDGGDGTRATGQRQGANEMSQDASILGDLTGQSVLLLVGATLLIVGLGLFALRWTARRFRDG